MKTYIVFYTNPKTGKLVKTSVTDATMPKFCLRMAKLGCGWKMTSGF